MIERPPGVLATRPCDASGRLQQNLRGSHFPRIQKRSALLRGMQLLMHNLWERIFAHLRAGHPLRPARRLRRAGHAAEFGERNGTTQATPPDGTLRARDDKNSHVASFDY